MSVSFHHDARDFRTNASYGAEGTIGYQFDSVGRLTGVVDSVSGTLLYTFDSLDRLTQEISPNGTNTWSYNDVGLRTNMTVIGQNPVTYLYDAANRLTNVVQDSSSVSLFYDDNGRRTKLVLPNGINVLYSYDSASRLTNITYQGAATNQIDYAYWDDGNRAFQESGLANYNLPAAISSATYNAANQQLTFGDYTIQYDLNGNMTNIVTSTTTNRLSWSSRNLLTNLAGSVTASFVYDGVGRRITHTVSGTTHKYLYDGLDIILQKDGSDAIVASYLRGLAIDEPWQRTENSTNEVYLADALGSIVGLTDDDEVVVTEYDYEPFGTTTEDGDSSNNPFKFTAREDDGTGFYHYRARYYHPALGRFVSEDPTGYAGGDINLYAYVGNDPIQLIDPTGESGVLVFVGGGLLLLGGGYVAITPPDQLQAQGRAIAGALGALYDALFDSKTHDEKDPGQNYEEITGRRDKQNKSNEGRSIKDPNSEFEGCKVRPKNPAINRTGKAGQRDAQEIEGY